MTRSVRTTLAAFVAASVPATAFAAGGSGPDWGELGASIVNFFVYAAIVVTIGRKPIAEFYAARRQRVVDAVEASARATAAADEALKTTMAKIANLDAERDAIIAEFRALGEQERGRIIEQATADATRIRRDAELAAEREAARARADLEAKLVDLALSKARNDLHAQLTPMSHARLIDSGIESLRGAVN
jgi:F-type H+-transporting ATPase subunit b